MTSNLHTSSTIVEPIMLVMTTTLSCSPSSMQEARAVVATALLDGGAVVAGDPRQCISRQQLAEHIQELGLGNSQLR